MLHGKRDADLAQILGRAERTAKRHVSEVLRKAGVPNRAALWSVLRNDGLLDGGAPDDGKPERSHLQVVPPSEGEDDGEDGDPTAET